MRRLVIVAVGCLVGWVAWPTSAQQPQAVLVQLVGDPIDLGHGLTGWTLGMDPSSDGWTLSAYLDLTLTGSLVQSQPFPGLDVDLVADADIFDGFMGYDKALDSYWLAGAGTPWWGVPPHHGVVPGTGAPGSSQYTASFGTNPDQPIGARTDYAYVVTDSPAGEVTVNGYTARIGQEFWHHEVVFSTTRPALAVDPQHGPVNYSGPLPVRIGTEQRYDISLYNTGIDGLTGAIAGFSGDVAPSADTSFGPLDRNEVFVTDGVFAPTQHGLQRHDVLIDSNGGSYTGVIEGWGMGPEFASSPAPDATLNLDLKDQPFAEIELRNESPDPLDFDTQTQLQYIVVVSGPDAAAFDVTLPNDPVNYLSIGEIDMMRVEINADYLAEIESHTRLLEATITLLTDQNAALGSFTGLSFDYHVLALVPEPAGGTLAAIGACLAGGWLTLRRFAPRGRLG